MICLYAQQIKERIKMNTTKASRRPIGLGETIDAEIEAIARSIELHRHALRDQGVWLFLAVLGCLGVPPGYPRLAALLAALVLFSTNYSLLYRHDVRSFPRQFAASRERISALATDSDARNEGLRRLAALEKDELSGLRPFASVLGFIIGWMAWSSSVIATLISIWNS